MPDTRVDVLGADDTNALNQLVGAAKAYWEANGYALKSRQDFKGSMGVDRLTATDTQPDQWFFEPGTKQWAVLIFG